MTFSSALAEVWDSVPPAGGVRKLFVPVLWCLAALNSYHTLDKLSPMDRSTGAAPSC